MLLLGFVVSFNSCDKTDINETIIEEEVEDPIIESGVSFRADIGGVETINIYTTIEDDVDCLFGQITGSPGSYSYLIGKDDEFQLLWEHSEIEPHQFEALPGVDGLITFVLISPCGGDFYPQTTVTLMNHKVTLTEVGDVGEVIEGTFEGEIAISILYADGTTEDKPMQLMSGEFIVPRI